MNAADRRRLSAAPDSPSGEPWSPSFPSADDVLPDDALEQAAELIRRGLLLHLRAVRALERASDLLTGAWAPSPPEASDAEAPGHGEPIDLPGGTTPTLTCQQRRVLELIGQGLSNRRIAGTMGISENTVKNYVHAIFRKLGVQCRTEAALYALRHGLSPDPPPPGRTG